nr:uncharacterized protein LOC124809161 isoform X1 [Hydra vulgaris]XP_047128841.1 uncharacterized protein LOC124809161 isoform X1 [Hydra vulgaris]
MSQWAGKLNANYNKQLKEKINITRTNMQNKTITNISGTQLTKNELTILNKGLKFIYSPQEPDFDLYTKQIKKFKRHIYCKMFFNKQNPTSQNPTKKDRTLKRPNPNWNPLADKNMKLKRYMTIIDRETERIMKDPTYTNANNTTINERKALYKLRRNKSITIKKTDKGGGICILDKKTYEEKILQLLEDKNTYDELPNDTTEMVTDKIINEIIMMRNARAIPEKVANFILPNTPSRTPLFYGLPKIHKQGTPLRPIVSGCDGPTDNLSEYVVKYLQPMAETLPAYFRDTTHLLRLLSNINSPESPITLITADVTSLYTNIPHNDGIQTIKNFITEHLHTIKFPPELPPIIPTRHFCHLIELILKNSSFIFGDRAFRQKFGTSMGARMAPPYANIFMSTFDKTIHNKFKNSILLYKRFIDDILIIFTGTTQQTEELTTYANTLHNDIKFTFNTSNDKINFMDITLQINKNNNTLTSKLYRKPTDTLSLLNFHSNHPRHQKIGIIYSQALRLNRLISDEDELNKELKNLTITLVTKNYPLNVINHHISRALLKTQTELITQSKPLKLQDNDDTTSNQIPIILPNDNIGRELAQMITKHWAIIKNDPDLNTILKPALLKVLSNHKSLNDLLISTRHKA